VRKKDPQMTASPPIDVFEGYSVASMIEDFGEGGAMRGMGVYDERLFGAIIENSFATIETATSLYVEPESETAKQLDALRKASVHVATRATSRRTQLVCVALQLVTSLMPELYGGTEYFMAVTNQPQEEQTYTLAEARQLASSPQVRELISESTDNLFTEIASSFAMVNTGSDEEVDRIVREQWCPALRWTLSSMEQVQYVLDGDEHNFYNLLSNVCNEVEKGNATESQASDLARSVSEGFNCVYYNPFASYFALSETCEPSRIADSSVDALNTITELTNPEDGPAQKNTWSSFYTGVTASALAGAGLIAQGLLGLGKVMSKRRGLAFGRKRSKTTRRREWSIKYKRSIDCKRPKGFSQKQYCTYGRRK